MDEIKAVITQGQGLVGATLTGATAAVTNNDKGPTKVLKQIRDISEETKENTETFADTMNKMFNFDKEKFRREQDQMRELAKEASKKGAAAATAIKTEIDESDFSMKALAGVAALALFAKQLGMNTDVFKLPMQIKAIRAMASFAVGVGRIATLGFYDDIVKGVRAVFTQFGKNFRLGFVNNIQTPLMNQVKAFKNFISNSFLGQLVKNFDTNILQPIKNFFGMGSGSRGIFGTISMMFAKARAGLKPVVDGLKGFFGALVTGTGLFAATGPLRAIIRPISAVARSVGKLFLPLTVLLGIFDGVMGFIKEYQNTGSIVDGIKGAVVGIVDGFIGSFVRIIGDFVGFLLKLVGLENLGKFVSDFGKRITGFFADAVKGIMNVLLGIITFDPKRIKDGVLGMLGGAANFFLELVMTPVNFIANLIKDIFGFGDPEKPFSLKDFILGEDGIVMKLVNWFKGLFSIDFTSIKTKLFNMGKILKGLGAGGIAAAKAILPGGESPAEAFRRVFNEYTKGGTTSTDIKGENGENIVKVASTDVQGNVVEYKTKTNTIKENSKELKGDTVITQITNGGNNIQSSNSSNTFAGKLNTNVDPYHDKFAAASFAT